MFCPFLLLRLTLVLFHQSPVGVLSALSLRLLRKKKESTTFNDDMDDVVDACVSTSSLIEEPDFAIAQF